jgi:nucleotide-binding universal stress UspA family protein
MYKKILVPLDGSNLAETALTHATNLIQGNDAELMLVMVVEPHFGMYVSDLAAEASVFAMEEAEKQLTEQFRTYLTETLAKLHEQGFRATGEMRFGPAADEIISFSKEKGADIIVMSSHSRSGLARWYLGSVADRVVHGATVPVLLVRSKQKN